jgi:hypothetical protein
VARGAEGTTLSLRPARVGEAHVLLAFDGCLTRLEALREAPQAAGPMALPLLDSLCLDTVALVPAGRTLLLGALRTRHFAGGERAGGGARPAPDPYLHLALLVTPRLPAVESPREVTLAEGRTLGFYSLPLLAGTRSPSFPSRLVCPKEASPAPDDLGRWLAETVAPASWRRPGAGLWQLGAGLLVRHDGEAQARVRDFLDGRRRARGRLLQATLTEFVLAPAEVPRLLATATPTTSGYAVLPAEVLEGLRRQPDRLRAVLSLAALEGRAARLYETRERHYVGGFRTVESGTSAAPALAALPLVERTGSGTSLEMRGSVLDDGLRALLELRYEVTALAAPPVVETPWGALEIPSRAGHLCHLDAIFPLGADLLVEIAEEGEGARIVILRLEAQRAYGEGE